MKFPIVVLTPRPPNAVGATLGQDCMAAAEAGWSSATDKDVALLLDLTGIKAVNASFLKATVYWALQCGEAEVEERQVTSSEPWAVRPLKLYPCITGCSREVADDVDEFFRGRGAPLLHVDQRDDEALIRGRVLGGLEPAIAATLPALVNAGEATAAELAGKSREKITGNGWNNRLAELHRLRLATRRRHGKFWIYSPTAEHVTLWD